MANHSCNRCVHYEPDPSYHSRMEQYCQAAFLVWAHHGNKRLLRWLKKNGEENTCIDFEEYRENESSGECKACGEKNRTLDTKGICGACNREEKAWYNEHKQDRGERR